MSYHVQAPQEGPRPALIIVMGVSGSGKSTVGKSLAKDLNRPFVDGDDLHPKSNVEKMSKGTPLTDEDRKPWLAVIRSTAERMCAQQGHGGELPAGERPAVVMVCSSLKRTYRAILRGEHEAAGQMPPKEDLSDAQPAPGGHIPSTTHLQTYFIFLDGTREVLEARMGARKGHFMPAGLLDSQLKTLENPVGEDGVARVDIDGTPEEVERAAREAAKRLTGL